MRFFQISIISACLVLPLPAAWGNEGSSGNQPIQGGEEGKQESPEGDHEQAMGDDEPECE